MWKIKDFYNDNSGDYKTAEDNRMAFLNREDPEVATIAISDYSYHCCTLVYKEREPID